MNAVMPRPLRIQYAGARYHVMSRGDRREAIFYDDAYRVEFLRTLGQACLKSDRLRIGSASYVSNLLSSVDSKLWACPVFSDSEEGIISGLFGFKVGWGLVVKTGVESGAVVEGFDVMEDGATRFG